MINYQHIQESIEYFNDFQRIEVPWTVTKEIADITAPENCEHFSIKEKNKVLVASGEQGFLYLYLKGFLPEGKFQAVTPCFRNDSFDKAHTKYFIKNELICTDNVTFHCLSLLAAEALGFFQRKSSTARLVKTEEGFDITINGIEVGSYGIRHCEYLSWIYGTACAEPRLTQALKM